MQPTTGKQSKLKGKASTYQNYRKKKEDNQQTRSSACAMIGGPLDSSSESSPGKTKTLSEIYQTCNLTIVEPDNYKATSKQEVWRKAMEEEIKMIEKNETSELVDPP